MSSLFLRGSLPPGLSGRGRQEWLGGELGGCLEDARIGGRIDVTEGCGVERRCEGGGVGWGWSVVGEVGVVEDVEGLEAKVEGETLIQGEAAAEGGVEVVVVGAAEGVATDVAEGSGGVLREGGLVEVGAVACGALRDLGVGVGGR